MKISEHAQNSEKLVGLSAEDIHKWIDGFFDGESFDQMLRMGKMPGFDPYGHRKYRHCREALEDAYEEFKDKYSHEQIKAVFECHIKDDYNGYLPSREDFENGTFTEKYHENDSYAQKEIILNEQELSEYFKGKVYSNKLKNNGNNSSGFRLGILLPTIIAIVLFVTSVFVFIVPVFKNNLMQNKKEMIKELVSAAVGVVEYYKGMEESGQMSRDKAMEHAADEIKRMRYGEENKDYFWITDTHPKMVMHPYRPELVGHDLSEYRENNDGTGRKVFVEFVNIATKNGSGYVRYLWQWMDDNSHTVPKISYVKFIPEWDWVIGTGVYINDIEEETGRLTENLTIIFTIISIALVGILASVVFQSRKIENDRRKAEVGLIEAKERYRALVEASNEGYILEVGGETTYSNHTLQRLTGYSQEEINSLKAWELLAGESSANKYGAAYLEEMLFGKASHGNFDSQLKTKAGAAIDVSVNVSKIFFSEKNGHVVSFRPITRIKGETGYGYYNLSHSGEGKYFETKTLREICRPLTENELEKHTGIISINDSALIYEALSRMKETKSDILLVVDEKSNPVGTISYSDIAMMVGGLPAVILAEIENSQNVGSIVQSLNQLGFLIHDMTVQGVMPDVMRKTVGNIYDAAIKSLIKIAIDELGAPPVPFAFLSLGSNARHEMTMFSDQDNALIFADVADDEYKKVQKYFLKLAHNVCRKLEQAGYPYCPGGIMAVNPKWCLSVSQWKENFKLWICDTSPQSILDINVFYDIRCVYGNEELTNELIAYVHNISGSNPQFLNYFVQNCLNYPVPIDLLGNIKGEIHDGVKSVNIKTCLKPLEIFARIYAFKNGLTEIDTVARIKRLQKNGILKESIVQEFIYVFDYLWRLRFYNQLKSHAALERVSDNLEIEKLMEVEHNNLRNVLSRINTFQEKLSSDFLGTTFYKGLPQ